MGRKKLKMPGNANMKRNRTPKVAIYIRVSTLHQIDKDSLPMQRKDLIAYSSLILGIEDYEIFEDAGYSGKNTDRPAFQMMMQRCRSGEFTHVLVWKIDRVSRNLLDFAEMYDELQALNVTFVSKNEQFDTSTAIGEAMLKIILVFAELERNMTSERVTATMISRANSGLWNGGRVPYGYNWDPAGKEFTFNDDEYTVVKLIHDKYEEMRSLVHEARWLNKSGYKTRAGGEWSPVSLLIILRSIFYCGDYQYNRLKEGDRQQLKDESEWITIQDHHPAIVSREQKERIIAVLDENSRLKNSPGKQNTRENVHIFSGLTFCGKCGSKLVSTPGRLHVDGYRPSNYSCPRKRKTHECDNPTVNDSIVGEFAINYIINMLYAKKNFSTIDTPDELEKILLFGNTFSGIDRMEVSGLNDFFNLLSRYGSDNSYTFVARKPKKMKAAVDPEIEDLRKEREKQERAFKRLQDLYLYSDSAISEKDFILRKSEITKRLDEINAMLGMVSRNTDNSLSDEEFVRQASHLLINKELQNRRYIYFKNLVQNTSKEVLKTYMETIIDSIIITDSNVTSIVFKNGLTHKFIYK